MFELHKVLPKYTELKLRRYSKIDLLLLIVGLPNIASHRGHNSAYTHYNNNYSTESVRETKLIGICIFNRNGKQISGGGGGGTLKK